MKIKNNQSGFSPIDIILVIVALGAIGAAVYFAVFHKTTVTTTKTVTVTKTVPAATPTSNSTVTADQAAAQASVKAFYSGILGGTDLATLVKDGYVTQSAVTAGSSVPGFYICGPSQQTLTTSMIDFPTPTISGNTGTDSISWTYKVAAAKATVNLNLIKSGSTWAISGFTCPTS